MYWFFQRIVDRLVARVTALVASVVDAHAELELGETRAELLRRANEIEQQDIPGYEGIAADLRQRAERLGVDSRAPVSDVVKVVATLPEEDLRHPEHLAIENSHRKPSLAKDGLELSSPRPAAKPKSGKKR